MADVEQILKRFKAAEARKTSWDTLYQEALDFAAPHRQIYYEGGDGQDKNNADRVFDGTSGDGLDGFVSNLQSSLVPTGKQWCSLKSGHGVDTEAKDTSDMVLENITKTVFDYIAQSNFDTQISTSFCDLAVGVGAMLVTKGTVENPLHFTSVHIAEVYLEEGPLGRIDTAFRKFQMPVRNIQGTWDDAKISEDLLKMAEESPDTKRVIVEAVVAEQVELFNKKTKKNEKQMGYTYTVIDVATKTKLVERTQHSSPWIIFRWPNLPGEIYGRGPLVKALPDIKVLNKIKELLLKKGSRDVYGIYTSTDDGVVNIENVQFGSMCIIPVESNGGGARGASLAALPSAGDVNFAQFLFNEIQGTIQKRMFAEPLGRVDLPVKTATEIAYRQQELAKKIGPAFGRLQFELMTPLIDRILYILDELGLVDLGGYKVDGRIIKIKYESPISKAQDLDDFQNYTSYVNFLKAMYGDQVMMAFAPPDKGAKYAAEKLGVPKSLLPSDEDVETMKQALLQQAVQAQMAAAGGGDPQAAAGDPMAAMQAPMAEVA
jgi:hypothetical protein